MRKEPPESRKFTSRDDQRQGGRRNACHAAQERAHGDFRKAAERQKGVEVPCFLPKHFALKCEPMPGAFQHKPRPNDLNAADAIPEGTCPRCGFPGPHESPDDCIAGLRDRIAVLEFRCGAGPQQRRPRQSTTVSADGRIRAHDLPRYIVG